MLFVCRACLRVPILDYSLGFVGTEALTMAKIYFDFKDRAGFFGSGLDELVFCIYTGHWSLLLLQTQFKNWALVCTEPPEPLAKI